MTKGGATASKKNKASRKKLGSSSTVSVRIASVIPANTRRKSGKRHACQDMCGSLPTPNDTSSDCHSEHSFEETKKRMDCCKLGKAANGKGLETVGESPPVHSDKANGLGFSGSWRCPSKFLLMCLKTIQESLCNFDPEIIRNVMPFYGNSWGLEFWQLYTAGMDVLEASGACSSVEQIAWIVSTAADSVTRKDDEDSSFSGPFLLYLVPSKKKASEVRNICKPLKALGIHTVSIHNHADLDHQIHGLKTCEPEFLVTTPERLLVLISLKAVDISEISLMVIDGSLTGESYCDMLKSINSSIYGDHRTVVFSNGDSRITEDVFKGPIQMLSSDNPVACL